MVKRGYCPVLMIFRVGTQYWKPHHVKDSEKNRSHQKVTRLQVLVRGNERTQNVRGGPGGT